MPDLGMQASQLSSVSQSSAPSLLSIGHMVLTPIPHLRSTHLCHQIIMTGAWGVITCNVMCVFYLVDVMLVLVDVMRVLVYAFID